MDISWALIINHHNIETMVMLSTQMELLHPSADIPYVGTQKDILGLKFSKTL